MSGTTLPIAATPMPGLDFESGQILVVNKGKDWTSLDAVNKLKYGLKAKKIGHSGTLDPLATGILVICTGKYTKLADAIQAEEKQYIANIRFGATTPSFDAEFEPDQFFPFEHITEEMLKDAMQALVGQIEQVPPIFSAVHVNGKRAYQLARAGKEVELKSRPVTIYSMDLISFQAPDAVIAIRCSKGTYIRSIARDLGANLTSGAYLTDLVRTRVGPYDLSQAKTVHEWIDGCKPNLTS